MGCLFCNGQEPNYKPGIGIEFICSQCVQLLLSIKQDDLKRSLVKAEEKGFIKKASAIKSFIIEDEFNVRETKKSKPYLERKRPLPTVRPSRHEIRT